MNLKRTMHLALSLILFMTVFTGTQVFAAPATVSMIDYIPKTASAAEGNTLSINVAVSDPANTSYQWYFEGNVLTGQTDKTLTMNHVTQKNAGEYYVVVSNPTLSPSRETSDICMVSIQSNGDSTELPDDSSDGGSVLGGGVSITGYTVLNAAGQEVQQVKPGEKCQIIVSLMDGRFDNVPSEVDAYGNIVNIKLTATSSFASPSFGDIKQSTPKVEDGVLKYAIIFNDITYLGGENTLTFDLSYVNNQVDMQAISCGISQCRTESEQANSAKPMVMVREANYGGVNIAAGQSFTLTIISYNTSKTAAITDVKTTLTLPADLTLAAGSNTTLTDSVGAGGAYTTTFTLQAQSSAETGVANLTVDFQYYIKGTDQQLSSSQMITVPIVQPDRFSFTSVDVPIEAYVGEESVVTVNYVNKGKGILYNLSSEVTTTLGTATALDPYLGNLNSGTEGSADFTITAQEEGTVNGTVTVIYEDINGLEKTQTQEFTFVVSPSPYTDPGGDIGFPDFPTEEMPSQGIPSWVWIVVASIVIAGGITGIIVIKKQKAKKRAALLTEDDDDEDF